MERRRCAQRRLPRSRIPVHTVVNAPIGSGPVYRSLILPPVGDVTAAASEARTGVPRFSRGLALSPDGGRLALFAPGPQGRLVLWVHSLGRCSHSRLAGTDGGSRPFWSPDGRHLAFVAEGKLKRIDASGGPVLPLYDGAREFSNGTWNRDNVILFAATDGLIHRISAEGGKASAITSGDASSQPQHEDPFILPDGRHFLVPRQHAWSGNRRDGFVGSLDSQERTKLIDGCIAGIRQRFFALRAGRDVDGPTLRSRSPGNGR